MHKAKFLCYDILEYFGVLYSKLMKGKKKISDYLTDRKYSLLQKQRQWVLCCGEDIAWLVGERTDNRFRVDEHTRKVTLVRMVKE